MKRIVFTLLLAFTAIAVNAQNYQCLQYGPRNFFTNGNGYIRGIRIDSVTTSGTDVIYHPYRSIRHSNYLSGGAIDLNGGSWLGKDVVQHTDGTFLFDNMWNSAITIKTQASAGDSWTFFSDTTVFSYIATLTDVDTMTVLGSIDSVKRITITADSAGFPRPQDPVNNFQIILSKNNGFAQVFDLYTFPYHRPDTFDNISYFDYHLDRLLGNLGVCDAVPFCPQNYPDTVNSVFRLMSLYNPTNTEIFNFQVGDVFASKYIMNRSGATAGEVYRSNITIDSILSKVITPFSYSYEHLDSSKEERVNVDGFDVVHSFIFSDSVVSTSTDTSRLLDLTSMPEEAGAPYVFHYFPDTLTDTSPCYSNGIYQIEDELMSATGSISFFAVEFGIDFPEFSLKYAPGYGLLSMFHHEPVSQTDFSFDYIYVRKGGFDCGVGYRPSVTAITAIHKPIYNISVFPNPASEQLNVKLTNYSEDYTANLYTITGQQVLSITGNKNETFIYTGSLPEGVYTLSITDVTGNRQNRKVVIIH